MSRLPSSGLVPVRDTPVTVVRLVSARVAEHRAARLRPLAEVSQAIEARFATRQPENAGQNPVSIWLYLCQFI